MFDQHRDMRLDIDNMTYEVCISICLFFFFVLIFSFLLMLVLRDLGRFDQELLALEERIGNVSTGLSEDLLSKCLTESVFFELELFQEKETCVICLVRILYPV